jgi:hypothetical protein
MPNAHAHIHQQLLNDSYLCDKYPHATTARAIIPCNGVNIEYNMRKMANAIGSCISVMMNPNIHERPIEAKMEKYTLNSLDFSFLSALGADFNVSWISRAMKKKMTALAETMMKPGRKKDR